MFNINITKIKNKKTLTVPVSKHDFLSLEQFNIMSQIFVVCLEDKTVTF